MVPPAGASYHRRYMAKSLYRLAYPILVVSHPVCLISPLQIFSVFHTRRGWGATEYPPICKRVSRTNLDRRRAVKLMGSAGYAPERHLAKSGDLGEVSDMRTGGDKRDLRLVFGRRRPPAKTVAVAGPTVLEGFSMIMNTAMCEQGHDRLEVDSYRHIAPLSVVVLLGSKPPALTGLTGRIRNHTRINKGTRYKNEQPRTSSSTSVQHIQRGGERQREKRKEERNGIRHAANRNQSVPVRRLYSLR